MYVPKLLGCAYRSVLFVDGQQKGHALRMAGPKIRTFYGRFVVGTDPLKQKAFSSRKQEENETYAKVKGGSGVLQDCANLL